MATGAAAAAAWISAAVAVVGTGVSIHQSDQAQKAAEKADAVAKAQAAAENQRNIKRAVADSKRQRAQVIAAAGAQGAGDSSGLAGGLGSAQSQLGSNVGFANQTQGANAGFGNLIGSSRASQGRAATAGAIANLPGQFGFNLNDTIAATPKSQPKPTT